MWRTRKKKERRKMKKKRDKVSHEKFSREEISWKEVYALNRRALGLWCRECPMLFVSSGLHSIIAALIPYLTLYFSARLLDELAGMRMPERLTRWVILLLSCDAAAYFLKALTFRWKEALRATLHYRGEEILSRKMLDMDFAAADDVATHNLLSQILQRERWSGWGLDRIYRHFESLTEELFRMFGAAALTVSLFRLPVRQEAGWLTLLNNPLCILLLLLVMLAITVLSPYLATKGEMCVLDHDETMKFGNRIYFFCVAMFQDEKRALDMRMYRQDVFGVNRMKEMLDPKTGVLHTMERDARGRMGGLFALSIAVSRSFTWVVYLFVCLKAWGGAFGVGSVTQYIGAIMAFSKGLSGMLKVLGEMKVNSDTLKKIFAFLDIPNEMYQGSLTVEKRSDRKYEIEFRNVSFRYPNTESYVLKNISLKFKVGERIAVVGQNGSGKTTFIKLLCRLYDPTEGEILLNGIDIRKYNYLEYLKVFSVVFQDFRLLSMSLGENVAAGSGRESWKAPAVSGQESRKAPAGNGQEGTGRYDREKAVQCLQKAGLSAWLATQPKGLDTILYKDLEEEGVQVSGGEAQKIAIARSLYHDAPFIILDEPTAALDPVAEYEIYTRFNEIVGDRTAIYISHRLSSCRFCDEILVFHEGHIVQQGSHEELLADGNGKYGALWNAQAQYYVVG